MKKEVQRIGIIGGSALTSIENLKISHKEMVNTPYGLPSCPVIFAKYDDKDVVFIHRHGFSHSIPPHEINYRANLWAMKNLGVSHIVAIAAVGGITEAMSPLKLVIPDQIIDYTYGRKHTYYDCETDEVVHIDFTEPYSSDIRECMINAATNEQLEYVATGVYAATQGPRLETAAEINKLERDGCDIVGMTGMPEAALARELDINYASASMVVNWAAGKGDGGHISIEEIEKNIQAGMKIIRKHISGTLKELA